MGREVVKAVALDPDTQLVGAVDMHEMGRDAGELAGLGRSGIPVTNNLAAALEMATPDVAVDFSTPASVMQNIRSMLAAGVSPSWEPQD
jgi:4-hydroxy-tetrahydrodipicolinate reductase